MKQKHKFLFECQSLKMSEKKFFCFRNTLYCKNITYETKTFDEAWSAIKVSEKKFLFCFIFVHLYKSLDLSITIMSCGLPSFRVSVAGNQVAVHKTRWFGDPVITVYLGARFHHSHCCCCFLLQAGDLQKEVVGRDGIHQ